MATVAYYRVSTSDQTIAGQRGEIEETYNIDKFFADEGVSGTVKAKDREGWQQCLNYLRDGDSLVVWSLDRLGRDSIDVQQTIAELKEKQVKVIIKDMGIDLSTDAGELLMVIMSKIAEMERNKIRARAEAGIKAAKEAGKHLGRPQATSVESVVEARSQGLSIKETAEKLGCSVATVKRLAATARAQAEL